MPRQAKVLKPKRNFCGITTTQTTIIRDYTEMMQANICNSCCSKQNTEVGLVTCQLRDSSDAEKTGLVPFHVPLLLEVIGNPRYFALPLKTKISQLILQNSWFQHHSTQ